jgi:hypothetical protein
MQDAKTFIDDVQKDLARTEEVLSQLTQAVEAFAEVGGTLTPEMLETIELLCQEPASPSIADALPAYAIPV